MPPTILCTSGVFPNGKHKVDAYGGCQIAGSDNNPVSRLTFGNVSAESAAFRVVLYALKQCKRQRVEGAKIISDSPLVVDALTGEVQVTDDKLAPLVQECFALMVLVKAKIALPEAEMIG